ncbi:MAG: peptidase [Desulfuromonas sp.]|uniref:DegQ family serine endoprotease n=1 Tax=Desulfuromonas sp. TaxID=892 RepID=UPI000CB02BA2|nr:DegQ family serine endoprotease [Desulfuromonas sp.]PLX85457.1 MAG: peptidase [Desulfuromonas sp.]
MSKKNLPFVPLIVLLLALAWPCSLPAVTTPDFAVLSQELKPAVVNISTAKTVKPRPSLRPGLPSTRDDFFDEFFERFFGGQPHSPRKERSLGSGFIISKDGFILTNDHVVNGADEIKVKLADGRTFSATVKGTDPKLDLALLKIDTGENLPVAELGDSEKVRVGEWVMAIGNPFGLEQTVTVGIVSAKGRVIGAGPYDDFIQTDASINPGNSGGPLFNARGEVVGINTAIIAGGQGIGFAIPVNAAKEIADQLRETGHVTRGWLGVSVQQVSEELAESFGLEEPKGALVSEVTPESPAEKAGIKRGDIITAFGGEKIDELRDLPRLVAATPVDKAVEVKVFRNGKTKKLSVKVGRLREEGQAEAAGETGGELGLSVADISPEVARRYDLVGTEGVLVTAIDPSGAASRSNLRPGDLILEINGKEVKNVAGFRAVAGKVKKDEVLRLLVQRGKGLFYTTLKVE